MINVEERWKVVFTRLDGQFPEDLFTRSFQQADLALSCGFMELCADSLGQGSPCKHLCPASNREEERNPPLTPGKVSCGEIRC